MVDRVNGYGKVVFIRNFDAIVTAVYLLRYLMVVIKCTDHWLVLIHDCGNKLLLIVIQVLVYLLGSCQIIPGGLHSLIAVYLLRGVNNGNIGRIVQLGENG